MHWALGTCQVYSSSWRPAIIYSLCFSENVKKQSKENKNPHPLMEPDLARGWTGGSFLPIPYLKVQNEEFFVVLSNEVDSKVNWDTPRKHGHSPPPKKRGKTFLNHLIFILKVQVTTGFKPEPSALNYTLSSCGLVSVFFFFLFWFMWEKGITWFFFLD